MDSKSRGGGYPSSMSDNEPRGWIRNARIGGQVAEGRLPLSLAEESLSLSLWSAVK